MVSGSSSSVKKIVARLSRARVSVFCGGNFGTRGWFLDGGGFRASSTRAARSPLFGGRSTRAAAPHPTVLSVQGGGVHRGRASANGWSGQRVNGPPVPPDRPFVRQSSCRCRARGPLRPSVPVRVARTEDNRTKTPRVVADAKTKRQQAPAPAQAQAQRDVAQRDRAIQSLTRHATGAGASADAAPTHDGVGTSPPRDPDL